jgi:hypothetical protein
VLCSLRESFNLVLLSFLFYLIIDRDCVTLPSIDVRTLTPPKDEVVDVRPSDHNSDARGEVLFDAAAAPIRLSPPLPGCHPTRDVAPSTTSMTTTTSTLATSASKGYHLHVVLADFCSSHSIHVITTLQLWEMSVHQILPLTYSPVSPSVVLLL